MTIPPGRPEQTVTTATIAIDESGKGMERTDWLDGRLDPTEARFLMLTAITHHQFSSPIWGEHEVRKLNAELAEIDRLAARAVEEHNEPRRSERIRVSSC